jgi:hypothetical protein
MANQAIRYPIEGGDLGAWAPFAEAQLKAGGLGAYSCNLYDDAGTLKISTGWISINNDTVLAACEIDTITSISLAAVSNSNWAKIEMSVSGASVTFSAADISGATDEKTLPSDFTDAFVPQKQGFYITSTKRVIGLAWKNAGGTLEGVINVLPKIDGYMGYSLSDDANDIKYSFSKNSDDLTIQITNEKVFYQDSSGTKSVKKIYTKVIEIGDWNMQSSNLNQVTHNLDLTKIIDVRAIVRDDSDTLRHNLYFFQDGADPTLLAGGIDLINATQVHLRRRTGGQFGTASYNATSYNRGWVIFKYLGD